MKTVPNRHIVVGDIHGEFNGLARILRQAGLIDSCQNWTGADTILVQTGDVIDRGPRSWDCVRLLRNLQEQATAAGGRVIRLCGNHETMLLQNPHNSYANFTEPERLATELRKEIRQGKVQAGYTDGTWLFTHAGLRSVIRSALLSELGTETATLEELVTHVNGVFSKAVADDDFTTHPIFNIDEMRDGSDDVGGIFWGDYALLSTSLKAYDIPQIFGHTPTMKKGVQHAQNFRLIDIDAGMYTGYGGNLLYLEIDHAGSIRQHYEEDGEWVEKPLGETRPETYWQNQTIKENNRR